MAIGARTSTIDDACSTRTAASVVGEDESGSASLAIIGTVTNLAVADGAVDAGIDYSIQGESCLAAVADTSKGVTVAAIKGT